MLGTKEAGVVRRAVRHSDRARGRLSIRDVGLTPRFRDVTPQQRLLGQSALQAFKSDLTPGAAAATAEDQSAVLVATLLRQSLAAEDDAGALPIREKALELARASLGEAMLSEGCTYDDHPARSTTDV